jgi:[acyl-carrier-protein] S-malonyltransferase
VLAIVCPGQGAQTPGFLTPWLELPGLRARAATLSAAADVDLVAHGTTSDAETIRDTAVAQPLIVGAGLLALEALYAGRAETVPTSAGAVAGHSVGEITAAAAVGVLEPQDAMRLVSLRGRAMAEASAITPTGMSAVLGGDPDEVQAVLQRHGLTPANMNGGGQVVAAGTMEQLAALAADPPAKARVIPLQVAGAFHTTHMGPAVDALREAAARMTPSDAGTVLLSNADGAPVTAGREVLDRLVTQVSNPVRWDACMEAMTALGVTHLIELAPAGTLVGLAKRGMKGVRSVALKTPDDLDAAHALIREAGPPAPDLTTP